MKTTIWFVLIAIAAGGVEAGDLFTDATVPAGISAPHHLTYFATGQAWADYDRDGHADLYLTDSAGPNTLYASNGDGTFSVSPLTAHVQLADAESGGAVFADYDNDGWPDLLVLNRGANTLFHNEGGTGFTDVSGAAGLGDLGQGESASWGDYDEDGDLDVYVVNWWYFGDSGSPLTQDKFYRNDGVAGFTDVSHLLATGTMTRPGFAVTFVDYDIDGDLDIYVVNDKQAGNVLWRNDGPGCAGWCFTDVSLSSGAHRPVWGMGIATGDYDNDGDLDFYFSSIGEQVLLQNQTSQGSPTFVDVSAAAGVDFAAIGWGSIFFDYDNDGWLDLYLSTDEMDPAKTNRLYRNRGDSTFEDLSAISGASVPARSFGVASCDYDKDGLVDFVVGNIDEDYRLYRNQSVSGRNWLALRVVGRQPVPTDPIGTRVELETSDGTILTRVVTSDSSLGAGNDLALHFGLDSALPVQATVSWTDGTTVVLSGLQVNTRSTLTYPDQLSGIFSDGFESGDAAAWDVSAP